MAELVLRSGAASQSSLLFLQPPSCKLGLLRASATASSFLRPHHSSRPLKAIFAARVAASADLKPSTILTDNADLASDGIDIEPVAGGGGVDNNYGDLGGGGGGGGSGGGGGGDREGEDDGGEKKKKKKKKKGLSVSQKLTLGYAALVGLGGVMGFVKSGSQKSLLAGGLSALVLCYVFTQLPTNTVFAAAIGLGVSTALTGFMGSRFIRSKKIFPAGVVSVVSLVMTAGYLHGMLRGMH